MSGRRAVRGRLKMKPWLPNTGTITTGMTTMWLRYHALCNYSNSLEKRQDAV